MSLLRTPGGINSVTHAASPLERFVSQRTVASAAGYVLVGCLGAWLEALLASIIDQSFWASRRTILATLRMQSMKMAAVTITHKTSAAASCQSGVSAGIGNGAVRSRWNRYRVTTKPVSSEIARMYNRTTVPPSAFRTSAYLAKQTYCSKLGGGRL